MGGFSSGRYGGKHTSNQMDALDIRRVHQAGRLEPGDSCTWTWTRASGTVSRISMNAGNDGVTLVYAVTVLDDTNTQHKIRLNGIDAPETARSST